MRSYIINMSLKYYAVAKGRKPGIYTSWDECKSQVFKYSDPVFKKFNSKVEAENFIKQNVKKNVTKNKSTLTCKRFYSQSSQSGESNIKPPSKRRKVIIIEAPEINCVKDKETVNGYITDSNGYVNVYTDGACSKNGKNGAKAGIGVWFGDNHPLNVSQPVGGRVTNNAAEIEAVTIAAKQAKGAGIKNLKINTDSKFLISCINKWMPTWKANNWQTINKKPVINKIELLEMEEALKSLNVVWNHVNGHVGIYGNEMADKLAREGAMSYKKV